MEKFKFYLSKQIGILVLGFFFIFILGCATEKPMGLCLVEAIKIKQELPLKYSPRILTFWTVNNPIGHSILVFQIGDYLYAQDHDFSIRLVDLTQDDSPIKIAKLFIFLCAWPHWGSVQIPNIVAAEWLTD